MADSELVDLAVEECHDKMRKAIEHLKGEFAAVRTGRANPGLVEKLMVDSYGAMVPLQQLAGFSVPEPRVLVIAPYDKNSMKAIDVQRTIDRHRVAVTPSIAWSSCQASKNQVRKNGSRSRPDTSAIVWKKSYGYGCL